MIYRVCDIVILTGEDIMNFSNFVEQKDGSCTVKVDLSPDETRQLIEYALVKMMKESYEKHSKENFEHPEKDSDDE